MVRANEWVLATCPSADWSPPQGWLPPAHLIDSIEKSVPIKNEVPRELMEECMHAKVGDRLVVHPNHLDDPIRDGEVIQVHGKDGEPPYLIRWSDDGHESLVFPGPGMQVVSRAA